MPEPAPQKGHANVWPWLQSYLRARVAAGEEKYGTLLQTFNGRQALVDALEESIDMTFYLAQLVMEAKDPMRQARVAIEAIPEQDISDEIIDAELVDLHAFLTNVLRERGLDARTD